VPGQGYGTGDGRHESSPVGQLEGIRYLWHYNMNRVGCFYDWRDLAVDMVLGSPINLRKYGKFRERQQCREGERNSRSSAIQWPRLFPYLE
jgi:hypothetical protein